MNCSRHPGRAAVGQCVECGAYVCAECAEATKSLQQAEGTLCVDCYRRNLNGASEFCRRSIKKRVGKIIISIIFYIAGIIMLAIGAAAGVSDAFTKVVLILGGMILCGFFTAIGNWRAEREAHEAHERKYGATYTITESGVYRDTNLGGKIVMFLLGAVLGVVITPISVIKDIAGIRTDRKNVTMFEDEIARVAKI